MDSIGELEAFDLFCRTHKSLNFTRKQFNSLTHIFVKKNSVDLKHVSVLSGCHGKNRLIIILR